MRRHLMLSEPIFVAVVVTMVLGVVGCGSGGGAATTGSKATWQAQHGASVTAVSAELDAARADLSRGDRQAILGSCGLLRDDAAEARKGLPVSVPSVDAPLRAALQAVATGVTDCLEGARLASVASITEKAMAELDAARTRMDQALQAITAWR